MAIQTGNSPAWLSTSSKILRFFYNSVRVFLRSALHSVLKPQSYARTIKIGDEADFFNSLNFFLVSISFYLTICSVFSLLSPDHAILSRKNPSDIIRSTQLIIESIILGVTSFFILFILSKRRITFTNFLHCWFHVSAVLVFTEIVTLTSSAIFFPPVGHYAQEFLGYFAQASELGQKFVEDCKTGQNDLACRIVGTPGAWALSVEELAVKLNIIDKSNTYLIYPLMMTMIISYFVLFMAFSLVFLGWLIHVQAVIQKETLHIPYLTSLCVILYLNFFFALLLMAFPGLADLAGYVGPGTR